MPKTAKPKIKFTELLFKPEGGKAGVKSMLVSSIEKQRRGKYSAEEIDDVCLLGPSAPKGSEAPPSWALIEQNPDLMNGFIFSLVAGLFDMKADTVLPVREKIKALPHEDYRMILEEMELNDSGLMAAAGGFEIELVSRDKQVVPYVVFRLFEELG